MFEVEQKVDELLLPPLERLVSQFLQELKVINFSRLPLLDSSLRLRKRNNPCQSHQVRLHLERDLAIVPSGCFQCQDEVLARDVRLFWTAREGSKDRNEIEVGVEAEPVLQVVENI